MKACGVKPTSSRNSASPATSWTASIWVLSNVMVSSSGPGASLLDAASLEESGESGSSDSSSSSGLSSLIAKNRKGATSAKKRTSAAPSSSSESAKVVVGEDSDSVEGLFAHGQHKICGIGDDGRPGGVGSGRERRAGEGEREREGEGESLSWSRGVERYVRKGTKRKPSSWGSGGLRR